MRLAELVYPKIEMRNRREAQIDPLTDLHINVGESVSQPSALKGKAIDHAFLQPMRSRASSEYRLPLALQSSQTYTAVNRKHPLLNELIGRNYGRADQNRSTG